jgi:hypothetical protein
MNPHPTILISAATTIADLQALIESYGLRLEISSGVVLTVPLFYLDAWQHATARDRAKSPLEIRTPFLMTATLIHCPAIDAEFEDSETAPPPSTAERWPFYVDGELTLTLEANKQTWSHTFTPGMKYEEIQLTERSTLQ